MPELPNAIPNEVIEADWGNDVRDRTLQRYANSSERTSLHPTPTDGDLSFLENRGEIEVWYQAAWRAMIPVGVVLPYSGDSAPTGYLMAQGQAVSRTTHARLNALYAAMGYPYGDGDGSTTFNVPDLRQRFPLGKAASGTGSTLGGTGGAINHTHSGPSHSHGNGSLSTGSAGSHSHSTPTTSGANVGSQLGTDGGAGLRSFNNCVGHTHTQGSTGSAGSHSHSTGNLFSTSTASGHTHSVNGALVSVSSAGGHTHTTPTTNAGSGIAGNRSWQHTHTMGNTGSTGSHSHSVSGSTASAGTGNTGTANPPFLVLNYIVKT